MNFDRRKATIGDMSPSFATLVIRLVILQCVFMKNPDDLAAGIETTPQFKRFSQRNDVFSRAFWDDTVRSAASQAFFASYRMEATPRRGDGFTQKDFALRNASWLISDIMTDRFAADGRREGFQAPISNDTPVAGEKVHFETPSAASANVKKAAVFFGADLCGVTDLDPRWLYEDRVDVRDMSTAPLGLPEGLTHVVVLGHEMDLELVRSYPSALGGAATGREYSHEAAIVMQLAAYIRNLGYQAVASMNDTGLVIPMAVQAGLGRIRQKSIGYHAAVRAEAAVLKNFYRYASGDGPAETTGGREILRYLHQMCRRLPGQSPPAGPTQIWWRPVCHSRCQKMDL
jgi:hypothetical protein